MRQHSYSLVLTNESPDSPLHSSPVRSRTGLGPLALRVVLFRPSAPLCFHAFCSTPILPYQQRATQYLLAAHIVRLTSQLLLSLACPSPPIDYPLIASFSAAPPALCSCVGALLCRVVVPLHQCVGVSLSAVSRYASFLPSVSPSSPHFETDFSTPPPAHRSRVRLLCLAAARTPRLRTPTAATPAQSSPHQPHLAYSFTTVPSSRTSSTPFLPPPCLL